MVPAKNTKSFESAIAGSELSFDRFAKAQARKLGAAGGRARRPDPLNELIKTIVSRRPAITCDELLRELPAHKHGGVIDEIADGLISYSDPSGMLKEISVSGLKDRLSRVRKAIAGQFA